MWQAADSTNEQQLGSLADLNWKVAGTGDFNADGRSDVLWRNMSTGANSLWGSGDAAQSLALAPVADLNWLIAAVGDYDGDGKTDILWRNAATGANTIWKMGSSAMVMAVSSISDVGWNVIDGLETGDLLRAGAGGSALKGTIGKDSLSGGGGNDVIAGRAGNDTMTGGAGADTFDFNMLIDSLVGSSRDVLSDFSSAQGDKLDLLDIDANTVTAGNQAFLYIGSAVFTAAGQLRFAGNVLAGDVDGNGVADFEIQLTGVTALTVADFVL